MTITNQLLCDLKQIAAEEQTSGTRRVLVKSCPSVLVVEDFEFDGEVLMAMLAKRCCDRVWVKTGASAISALESGQSFDIMFLDLALGAGALHGVDVLRHVIERKIKVAVVVVSGYLNDEIRTQLGCRPGVLRIIEKPIEQKDIDEIFDTHRFTLE